jgi:hypothetical protein
VGTTLVPQDSVEAWVLSDWLVSRIAFNPLLSKHMSDENRERQTLSSGRLDNSVVHSLPEFIYLPPNNIGNGAPKTSVERL